LADSGKGSSSGSTQVPPRGGKSAPKKKTPTQNQSKSTQGNSAARQQSASSGNRGSSGRRAAQQAQRRRRNWIIAAIAVGVVVVLIAVFVVIGLNSSKPKAAPRTPLTDSEMAQLTSVPISTLVAATKMGVSLQAPSGLTGAPLIKNGKPEMLYIGAEFCPICATERWPMMVALSHFGTFSNVSQTSSAALDGNIPTLSFYGSSFDSADMVFTPVETTTNQPQGNYYVPLEKPTADQQALWSKLLNGNLSFPFINMGGKYLLNTSQFSSSVLSGSSFSEILGDVGNNNTTIGKNIDAAAGALVRYLCNMTGEKPAATCAAVATVPAPTTSGSGSGSSSSAAG
jgi:hypothetical protein